jgi:transcriptional regulator with XRE-family HTH domain
MPIPSFEKANTLPSTEVLRLLRDRVRVERRKLGYSQKQFAAHCGIPLRTFKRFELGGCDSVGVLIQITQGFGRGPGFDMLFPAQPLPPQPRGMEAVLQSIRSKLDATEIQ